MKTLSKFFHHALMAMALWAVAGSAMALQWNFSYDFPNNGTRSFASGALTTTDTLVSGSYTITGITGTRTYNGTTNTITGLLAPGTFQGNDNLLFPNAPSLSGGGFSFTIDGNNSGYIPSGNQVNVFFSLNDNAHTEDALGVGFGAFSVTPVPEPAALLMAGAGLAVLVGAVRRRTQQVQRG